MQGISLGGQTTGGSSVGSANPLPVYTPSGFGVQLSDGTRFADVASIGTAGTWREGVILLGRDTNGTWYPIPLTAGGGTVIVPVGTGGTLGSEVLANQGSAGVSPWPVTGTVVASGVTITGGTETMLLAGTNTVGTFTQANNPAISGTVALSGQAQLASGTNTIGTVIASVSTGTLSQLLAGTEVVGTFSVNPLPVSTNSIGTVTVANNPSLPSGTNTIGTFNVTALPTSTNSIGTVTVANNPSLPAGTNTIGTVIASVSTGTLTQLLDGTNTVGTVVLNAGGTIAISSPQNVLASGTNVAGTVSINPIPTGANVMGTVTVGATVAHQVAAGTNLMGTVSINALPTSTNSIGTVTVGAALPTSTNTIGTVNVNPLPTSTNSIGTVTVANNPAVSLAAGTLTVGTVNVTALPTGANVIGTVTTQGTVTAINNNWVFGTAVYFNGALVDTAGTVLSAAGTLIGGNINNPNGTIAYVQFFDTVSSALAGTTTPTFAVGIPASGGNNLGAVFGDGYRFANGMKVLAANTPTGSVAPTTGLSVSIIYR